MYIRRRVAKGIHNLCSKSSRQQNIRVCTDNKQYQISEISTLCTLEERNINVHMYMHIYIHVGT